MSNQLNVTDSNSSRDNGNGFRNPREAKRRRPEPIADDECRPHKSTVLSTDVKACDLLSQFICYVCLDLVSPPILQCPNGHLFCQSCRKKLSPSICPACRESLPIRDIHNRGLEQMATSLGLLFACKNQTNGCSVTTLMKDKATHEKACEFQPLKCIEKEGLNSCQWIGTKEELVTHLVTRHQFLYLYLTERNFPYTVKFQNLNRQTKFCLKEILHYNNHRLVYALDIDYSRGYRTAIKLLLFSTEEEDFANRFSYKLEISNQCGGPRIDFEDRLKSYSRLNSDLITNGFVLIYNPDISEQYRTDNGLQNNSFDVILTLKSSNI